MTTSRKSPILPLLCQSESCPPECVLILTLSHPIHQHSPCRVWMKTRLTRSNRSVIYKLLAFTVGMVVLPIGSYFLTVNTVFRGMPLPSSASCRHHHVSANYSLLGNSSFAGGFAAVMANVVLIAYIIVAMNEEQTEQPGKPKPDSKKDQ